MTQDNKGIISVPGSNKGSFLTRFEGDSSLDTMSGLVKLPRLKIIQGQSDPAIKKQFGEGSVIIKPGDALVWRDGNAPFLIVPLFFHREWIQWADVNDPNLMIVEGPVFSEDHPIAKKAQSAETREEIYTDDLKKPHKDQRHYSYVEHLCWTCMIYGEHDLAGTEVVLGMERGEYGNGRAFINAISMRRQTLETKNEEGLVVSSQRVKVPMWAQVWALQPGLRDGERGSWYGFDFQAADNPIIDESDADAFSSRHAELARLFKAGQIAVQHGDANDGKGKPSDTDE